MKQDFVFDIKLFTKKYEIRWRNQYKFIYEPVGVVRGYKDAGLENTKAAMRAYGTPHVTFFLYHL
jgi:hypothetical protein